MQNNEEHCQDSNPKMGVCISISIKLPYLYCVPRLFAYFSSAKLVDRVETRLYNYFAVEIATHLVNLSCISR
jgi:hypothetical protein